jgi:hypothetical protein
VLLAGGSALGSALASTLIFDAEAGSLLAGPNLATPRAGASATRLQDGSVLVAGGSDGSAELASCERFDSVSNVFLPVAESLATARRGHGAVLLPGNGSVLLFGGSSAGADLDSSERYLPWSGDLVAAGSIGAPRRGAADCAEAGRLLVLGGEGLATSMAFAFPSVTTDRFEYLPSETAHIAGAGFLPLETVTLQVTHMTGGCGCGEGHDPFSVTADAAGRIATTWFVDPDDSLGALFRMTADGADGRHAETVFADSPKVGSVDVGPQTPPSIAPGASATYLVTVNRGTGPGSNGSFTANMSITSALPAGVGATFVPAIVSFSPTQDSRTTTLTLTTTGATPPGSASFTVQASTSANDFATGTGTLSVQGSQTITFPPVADRVYGAAPFTLTATASSGLPVTFSLDSGPVSLADDLVTITGAGSVTVRASQAGNASYAPAPDVVRTFAITRAPLSATPANASREYGEPNPGFTGSLVGVQYADDITASYASVATAASAVGTYPITATLNDPDGKLGNYDVTLNEGTLTITVAPLSVTPANASREYGEPNPAFGGSIVGIKNGDDITATYASVATAASSVGTYPITATLDDPDNKLGNYDVTLNQGALTVTVAPLSVTPANASREYGEPNPALGGSIVGIKNGDDITATYASVATAASSVGTYPITATLDDPDNKLGNYDVTLNEGTLAITVAPLSVTPANASREYGEPNPGFGGSIVGIKNGDDITATYASVATAASSVGTYPITANLNDPDGKLGNYDVTLNEGTLTITVAPLSVTPANASREYGEPNPAFSGSIVGIKNGDDITATYASVATAASSVGTYPITATLDDPDNKLGNYDVTLNEGTLTITVAPLSVTPANASREYGEPNPGFGGSIVGIKNGDDITATYASVATAASSVGTYPITANLNDPDGKLGNYDVTLNEGTLTITVAPLSVTPANASRGYGAGNPPFSGSTVGLKNGDPITASYSCAANSFSPIGTYPITATLNDPSSKLGNYLVTLNTGTLTIGAATLTVQADDKTKVLGSANPVFTGTITGILNGDDITATYASPATASSPVGSYPIVPTLVDPDGKLSNYTVTVVNGTLSIRYAPAGTTCSGIASHQILQPINPNGTSVFKQKSSVPAKFRVCDAAGNSVALPNVVASFNLVQIVQGDGLAGRQRARRLDEHLVLLPLRSQRPAVDLRDQHEKPERELDVHVPHRLERRQRDPVHLRPEVTSRARPGSPGLCGDALRRTLPGPPQPFPGG